MEELLRSDREHEHVQFMYDKHKTNLDLTKQVDKELINEDKEEDNDDNEPYATDGNSSSNLQQFFNDYYESNMFIQKIFMFKKLSISSYFILVMIGTIIGLIVSYSLGVFHRHSKQIDEAMLRLDLRKQNRLKILENVKSNCSQLIVEYPEFNVYPQINLCSDYDLSSKLVKLTIILSTLYNIYLFYMLYRSILLSIIIMGISSTFLFNMNFFNNGQILHFLDVTLVFIGFVLIVGHILLTNKRVIKNQQIHIAYSDEEEICNLCCRLLSKIVKRQRDLDVSFLVRRMYGTTWLESLFQSCQRKSNNGSSKDEHLSDNQHGLLSYEQLLNFGNDALIWFRAIWECAQFCVMNKLKTPLGKPQETFLALEEILRFFAWPIDNNTKKVEGSSSDQTNRSSTPSSTTVNPPATASSSSGEANVPADKGDWWCDLHRCGLLLQLIEALE
ncbi:unnamed protein product, partial [Rotaria socialis]